MVMFHFHAHEMPMKNRDFSHAAAGRFKPLANLYAEIEHEACWLQVLPDGSDLPSGKLT